MELLEWSANEGNTTAMSNMGWVYENGEYGQEKDLEEALKWYQMAAENNHEGAGDNVYRVKVAIAAEKVGAITNKYRS